MASLDTSSGDSLIVDLIAEQRIERRICDHPGGKLFGHKGDDTAGVEIACINVRPIHRTVSDGLPLFMHDDWRNIATSKSEQEAPSHWR